MSHPLIYSRLHHKQSLMVKFSTPISIFSEDDLWMDSWHDHQTWQIYPVVRNEPQKRDPNQQLRQQKCSILWWRTFSTKFQDVLEVNRILCMDLAEISLMPKFEQMSISLQFLCFLSYEEYSYIRSRGDNKAVFKSVMTLCVAMNENCPEKILESIQWAWVKHAIPRSAMFRLSSLACRVVVSMSAANCLIHRAASDC